MKILKKAAFAACFVLGAGAVSASELLVVADEWAPFSGANLPGKGMSLDVITTVLERAGHDVRSDVVPWARVMKGARDGTYDVVGSLFYDKEIAEFMLYSDPFYETRVKFMQAKGKTHDVTSLEALLPYSIAVGDGFLYEPAFDRSEDLNKVVVTTTQQAVQMVAFERADLTLDSEEVLSFAIRGADTDITDKVDILPHVLASHNIHMAVRRDFPGAAGIVADFNAALAEMRRDGSLDALLGKHVTLQE